MDQAKKTLAFVVVAFLSVVLAVVVDWATRPKKISGFEKVGQEFYPDFKDPNEATALRVVVYDENTATAKPFMVEFKDGAWRIPSHHNYPADAKDRLARTAASLIGIKREALATRRPSDYARFGVIDPLDESNPSLKGRGHRITLFKNGNVLVDFIIGKKVEGTKDEYYVRRADEREVYRAKLHLDVSTKFADWVEPDLLRLNRYDLVKIRESKPIIDPTTGRMTGEESFELVRKDASADWKLVGLDEQKEELDKSKVTSLEFALDDLRLVGVRPKPQYEGKPLLNADLTFNPPEEIKDNPQLLQLVIDRLRSDLAARGFVLGPDQNDPKKTRVYSREGELTACTRLGVVYHLNFGNVFEGTEEEIEIGKGDEDLKKKDSKKDQKQKGAAAAKEGGKQADSKDGQDSKQAKQKAEQQKTDNKESGQDSDTNTKLSKSRYLFVRVEFDESLLGPKPKAPKKPKKPKGVEVDKLGADEAMEKDPKKRAEKEKLRKQYEEALKKYEEEKKKYDEQMKRYQQRVKDGKKKVEELNARFANWYYVISEDSFKKLCLRRQDLVKPKKKAQPKKNEQKSTGAAAGAQPSKTSASQQNAAAKVQGAKNAGGKTPNATNKTNPQAKGAGSVKTNSSTAAAAKQTSKTKPVTKQPNKPKGSADRNKSAQPVTASQKQQKPQSAKQTPNQTKGKKAGTASVNKTNTNPSSAGSKQPTGSKQPASSKQSTDSKQPTDLKANSKQKQPTDSNQPTTGSKK